MSGPAFTHPLPPDRAHFLGSYTPISCPDEYIAAVRHLLDYHRYDMPDSLGEPVPLVINTQGWVKGLGADLLGAIEQAAQPTHVFAFTDADVGDVDDGLPDAPGWTRSPPPLSAVPVLCDTVSPAQTTIVEPAPTGPLQSRYTSADFRALSMISYFHSDLAGEWDSPPLLSRTPLQTTLSESGPIDRIYLIGEGADAVLPEHLPLALNGSIVALLERHTAVNDEGLYLTGRPPPSLDDTNFLGLALVRAVRADGDRIDIQLLTPLKPEVLARARVLVRDGAMEMPVSAIMDWRDVRDGSNAGETPFLEYGVMEGVGVERRRFRRNLMRKGGP